VLTFQDLTEVMELEREVRRQERLAALGKMAAGLAHEIRNPLASMRGSVQVLASELDLSPEQLQLMNIVLRESERLNRIVSDFLTYARPPKTDFSQIELSSLLAEAVALLRNNPELGPKHLITEHYPSEPVFYLGDANQLKQIFWNLSRNAVQAMPQGGELRVSLEVKSGSDVIISFGDTGQGMSPEQKERLFEPFNSSSGGTGLGMAIVYQLVRDHNGKILVDSEIGNGTKISIKLPSEGLVVPETKTSPNSNLLADNPQTPVLAGSVS
jgi:two-component system, NtrC family, sensor histidine kinase PilS